MAFDSLYLYYRTTPELFKENLKYYQYDMQDFQKMLEEKINLITRKNDSITLEPVKLDTSKVKDTVLNSAKVKPESNKPVQAQVKSLKIKK